MAARQQKGVRWYRCGCHYNTSSLKYKHRRTLQHNFEVGTFMQPLELGRIDLARPLQTLCNCGEQQCGVRGRQPRATSRKRISRAADGGRSSRVRQRRPWRLSASAHGSLSPSRIDIIPPVGGNCGRTGMTGGRELMLATTRNTRSARESCGCFP